MTSEKFFVSLQFPVPPSTDVLLIVVGGLVHFVDNRFADNHFADAVLPTTILPTGTLCRQFFLPTVIFY
jgi:hypothetical protein